MWIRRPHILAHLYTASAVCFLFGLLLETPWPARIAALAVFLLALRQVGDELPGHYVISKEHRINLFPQNPIEQRLHDEVRDKFEAGNRKIFAAILWGLTLEIAGSLIRD
ncbi:hypothetical protein VZ95_12040 [Elstera litoralis]|uniref:Uncharacterized protein n=2 Tax=Elstera litoralis TaxID=552518 RepID=A0A0F3IRG8_9PROT|nr:hypothetical protein VZ95_12040 [Elstera litoralis]